MTTGHGLPGLLDATGDHPFVRWEVTPDLADTWWRAGDAVAFQRTRKAVRRTVNILGDDDGATKLIDALPLIAATVDPERKAFSVSVPQHLEPRLRERYRIMEGGDWEWLHTTVAPAADPSHDLVRPLDDVAHAEEVSAFLAAHSPTADTEPGTGERWFAVEAPDGSLAAVAAWGTTGAGAPHLSSVAVDSTLRGRGLGRTVAGALTRMAVAETGVCTLGMYSHNDVGRRLYRSLGYAVVAAWASRPVVVAR
ncbi:GNAT family N-acetyltransferase [Terrabacter sp. MAHUQ-38]|uniref:GNAT family N-acetyltransferase n=1 Tax=unclassified Terrabacter TaxID=2630222 RepID=UPI00165D3F18|nr:GNAT family N-acetyltransferase [Terrabacter sp. MAHUQ-38]